LRALGDVTAATKSTTVVLDGCEFNVAVALRRFPNGGGWSKFVCPGCGWSVRVLRLLDGAVVLLSLLHPAAAWDRDPGR
jgi:hypothetical protein